MLHAMKKTWEKHKRIDKKEESIVALMLREEEQSRHYNRRQTEDICIAVLRVLQALHSCQPLAPCQKLNRFPGLQQLSETLKLVSQSTQTTTKLLNCAGNFTTHLQNTYSREPSNYFILITGKRLREGWETILRSIVNLLFCSMKLSAHNF